MTTVNPPTPDVAPSPAKPAGAAVPLPQGRQGAAQAFYDIAALAALALDMPIAVISLRDGPAERVEAWVGLDTAPSGTAELTASLFADDTSAGVVVIPDTRIDSRTASHPLVTGPAQVRSCIQAPVRAADGSLAGTLRLLAPAPHAASDRDLAMLRVLTNRISAEVDQLAAVGVFRDEQGVLDRERRALQESAAVYRMLVEQSGDSVLVVDEVTMRITEVNDSAVALTGYSRAELMQLRTSDLVLPEDLPVLLGAISEIESGKRIVATRRLRRKDGSLFWGEVITKKLPDGRRQSIVRNVSERIRLEEERAAILERVTDAFMALDADGRFTWINEKAAATFGRRQDELLGRNIWIEFGDTISAPLRAACEAVMHDQQPVTIEDYYAPHDRWYEDRIFPSKTGLSVFFSDITERKKAEAELNLSEARFRVLVEQGADVVFMLDREGRITWCSPSVQRVLGYTPAEVVGKLALLLLFPDDREQAASRFSAAMQRPGTTAVSEFRVVHRDGTLRTIRGFGVNRFDDPVFGAFVGSWHDITEQREAERVLVGAADQLRRLTQRLQVVRDEEQAHLSRELHDRLGQSLTMLKLGLSRVATLIPTDADAALTTARQLTGEVDATIHATRQISADLRPPLLDDFGLAAALDWAAQRFTARTGLPCHSELEECSVKVDAARALYAITQEAFTNIVRHAGASSVRLRLWRTREGIQLDVQDDGVGIPWSVVGSEPRGLGLLGMRERATAVGATLSVYPGAVRGTTVTIRLAMERSA